MNCRPFDLARVLTPGIVAVCPGCRGLAVAVKPDTLVIVERLDPATRCWSLQEPIHVELSFACGTSAVVTCTGIDDHLLKPIRDPGDDAIDEVLVKVGAPNYGEVAHG